MVSYIERFFRKYNTLTKLVYFAFAYAGLMSKKPKIWFPLFTAGNMIGICMALGTNVAEVFLGRKEFQAIVGLLSTSITCTFGLARAIRFFQRKKEIISVLDRLEILRSRMEKDEENKQFLAHAENVGRKFSTLIFVSCNSYPIASCFHVLLTNFLINVEEKELVYRVWTPWNSQEVMGNIIANIALTLMALPLLSTYAAIHLLEVTFTFYISAYVKSIENDVVNKGIGHEDVYEQHKFVIQIIRDHNKILSGIKYWEAQISPLMPCGFGYSCLKAIKKNEISIAVDYYVRATLALIPQFVNCCCGQQVTSQMENLHYGTYMCKWYEESARKRKNFLTMMIRTTKTPTINYRLFVNFDHQLLGLILQTVYSYITLIVNIDEE